MTEESLQLFHLPDELLVELLSKLELKDRWGTATWAAQPPTAAAAAERPCHGVAAADAEGPLSQAC